MKNEIHDKIIKVGQGCDSKSCKEHYKKELLVKDECPTTAHEINLKAKTAKCLMCGKISKI